MSAGSRSEARSLVPWVCLLAGWVVTIAAGCVALEAYARSPGAVGRSLGHWPREGAIPLDGRRPTLLMFVHPLCPCSRASVDELAELAGRWGDRVRLNAVVLSSAFLQAEDSSGIERALADVPGMKIWIDRDGALARRFGVLTSGHVLIYEPGGRLLYSGGITPSRAERGENPGRSALLAAILGRPRNWKSKPVFGCPLFDLGPVGKSEARK